MTKSLKNIQINNSLSKWYNVNKRNLPWRDTRDPYIIWISEIILQQTRVSQGYDYFNRFVKRFPTVAELASAEEEEVLKLWQGLGYYSRARNLHKAAQDIISKYDGRFPDNHKDILSLKGIGEYTAAAITSFAYNLPYAVVDGNVYRVLSRLYAIGEPIDSGSGKKLFAALAQDLLNEKDPATHNQAIMELGALQCVPINPICPDCPINSFCLAYASNTASMYPVKQGKVIVKERFFNYLNIRYKSFIYLNKRIGNDVWKNLYELPLIETNKQLSWEELQSTSEFKSMFEGVHNIAIKPTHLTLKHILSHRIIYATFYEITIDNDTSVKEQYIKIDESDLSKYPISRLVDKYFEKQK